MNVIFNELSLQNIPSRMDDGDKVMQALIEKLMHIQQFSKINLNATVQLGGAIIAENYTIGAWARKMREHIQKAANALKSNTHLTDEERLTNEHILKSKAAFDSFLFLLTQKPVVRDYPPYYTHQGKECNGLGIAYEQYDFAISYNYNNNWDADEYILVKTDENENGTTTEEKVSMKHFGLVTLTRINAHSLEKGQMLFYDCDSKLSPRDNQTILFNAQLFTFTGKHFPFGEGKKKIKRKIYRRKSDGTYWYVDNLHYYCATADGKGAHLEVFDANKNHIGTAHIQTGVIDTNRKDDGRNIKSYV